MANQDPLKNIAETFSNASTDLQKSTEGADKSINKLALAFSDLSKVSQSTFTAFTSGENSFTKFNDAVNAMATGINNQLPKTGKGGGISAAIKLVVKAIAGSITAVFEYNDAVLKSYDSLSDLGVSAGISATGMGKLFRTAGYYSEISEKFVSNVKDLGTGLIGLGPNTAEGTKQLANIYSKAADVQSSFLRLGLAPEQVNKLQNDYIKLQLVSGVKLSNNTAALAESSIQYAKTVTKLSMLTGEKRDEMSAEIAVQNADIAYLLTKRGLITSGQGKIAEQMDVAASILSKKMGPNVAAGVRDFIANGTATTEEGKSLMLVTGGEISTWTEKLNDGRMSGAEYSKKIAQAYIDYTKLNKKALKVSEDYQRVANIGGKNLAGMEQIANMGSDKDVDALIKSASKEVDDAKKSQNKQLATERAAGQGKDALVETISGPVNNAFIAMNSLVRQLALGVATLGKTIAHTFLSDAADAAFSKMVAILGDSNEGKKLLATVDTDIAAVDTKINQYKLDSAGTIAAQQELATATAEREKLRVSTANLQGKERIKLERDQIKAQERYHNATQNLIFAKEKEKRNLEAGGTTQLVARRAALVKERQEIATEVESKVESEQAASARDISAFIKFGDESGGYSAFSKINPKMATSIIDMAQRYFAATKRKLELNSSYRDPKYQQELYDAWLAAGGGPNNPTVNTPDHGKLTTPVNPASGRSSNHMRGTAVDINSSQLAELEKLGILTGNSPVKRLEGDPPHLDLKAKLGGMFTGPETGFGVELHGTEAVIPMRNNAIPIEFKRNTPTNDFMDIRNSINTSFGTTSSMPTSTNRSTPESDLVNTIIDRVEKMIAHIEKSNIIQNSLKVYQRN